MAKAFKPRELKPVTDVRPFAFGKLIDDTTGDHGYLLRWKIAGTYYGWNEWFTSADDRQLIVSKIIRARREMRRRIATDTSETT